MDIKINMQKAITELKRRGVNFTHYNTKSHNLIELDDLVVNMLTGEIRQHDDVIGFIKEMPREILDIIFTKLPTIIPTNKEEYKNIVVVFSQYPLITIFFDGALLKDDSIDPTKVLEIRW